MRILVTPRDVNPYQGLLYGEMRRLGGKVSYIGRLTPVHTINVLLLPLEVVARRVAGARIVHIHWVYAFTFPGAGRFLLLRRMAQLWFTAWLRICRFSGLRIVWTLHNVLPHEPVFADDVAARRELVQASDLVLAHSREALAELAAIGAVPRRSVVIPHGPFGDPQVSASHRVPGSSGDCRRFLFFGRLKEYKGVDDLLAAFLALSDDVPARLTVAGQCDEPQLRARLTALATRHSDRLVISLQRLPNGELAQTMEAADVVVLPFRRVTTSGSAMLALSHGRPLIVPDFSVMNELPDAAVIRYDGSAEGLTAAMLQAVETDRSRLAAMSEAAQRYAYRISWREIAERTMAEMAVTASLGTRRGWP